MPLRSALTFFALVFALSLPFWWMGSVTDRQLMPGLSVSALMSFCPMVAALLLLCRRSGIAGALGLLNRSLDFRRMTDKRWYLPILLLMPALSALVYGQMRALDLPLPAPADLAIVPALLMFAAFFVGALGEELGWSGYILDPLQTRWNALQSGLILGLVSVAWHLVPLLVMHRPPTWIAWWCLYAVSFRILTVWLFNNTGGSVFAVALFHATLNLSFMLFPVNGSHFDMRLGGWLMACAAAMVTVLWGPRTLTRAKTTGGRWPVLTAVWLGILGLAILVASSLPIRTPVVN